MKINSENTTLYLMKAIASFFVVCIHISFPRPIGTIVKCFASYAVPLFFMISGYYTFYKEKDILNKTINRRIKKICKLAIISFIFYFVLNCIIQIKDENFNNYIAQIKTKENILKFLILNYTTPFIGVGHLWYIFSLIYVYGLVKIVNKYDLYKRSYIYSIILIIIVYILEVINVKKQLNIDIVYLRNAWTLGFPCFMLGRFIHQNKKVFLLEKEKFKNVILVGTLLTFFVYSIEIIFISPNLLLYLNSFLVNFLIFFVALNYPKISILYKLGKLHSSNIYIIHYAIIIIFQQLKLTNVNSFIKNMLPFIIYILSLGISIMYLLLKDKAKNIKYLNTSKIKNDQ